MFKQYEILGNEGKGEELLDVTSKPQEEDEKIDFIFPKAVFPSNRIFKAVGEEKIRELVRHHHNLIRESSISHMYPKNDKAFEHSTKVIEDFFVEFLGGEKLYTSKKGHPMLRKRHFPFTIDEKARDVWLECFKQAIIECEFPEEFRDELWEWIEPVSVRMLNRRTTLKPIVRHKLEKD